GLLLRRALLGALREQLAVLADRDAEIDVLLGEERRLEVAAEDRELAPARLAGPLGDGEAVPRTGERDEVRAAAAAVRGEHRADAPIVVGVRADDDLVRADAVEHRDAGLRRKTVDRESEVVDGRAVAS